MKRWFGNTLRRRPVVTMGAVVCALLLCAVAAVQGLGWARWEAFSRRVEAATRTTSSASAYRVASWSFAFRDRAVVLRVPVAETELAAAQGVDTSSMFRAAGSLREHYIADVVRLQSGSGFITSLSDSLRAVQRERGLDDDEYLELVVRAVQSLRYSTVSGRVRLPIEVVTSGFGVCSEKALLLASLMLHEGYDTAMWVFDSQNHVAVGVASDGATFRDTGYSFVETTRIAYVGEYDAVYLAAGPVSRPPQFMVFGGTRPYRAGRQVEYILGELDRAKKRSDSLQPYVRTAYNPPPRLKDRYVALASESQAARSLANYIRGQTDERAMVFERLAGASSGRRDPQRGIAVQ